MKDVRNETNESLMRDYGAGSEDAFNELYGRFKGRIYGYIRSRGVAESDVSDLFQDFFSRLHRIRHKYRPTWKVEGWFFTIAHNLVIDHFRTRKQHAAFDEETIKPEEIEKVDMDSIKTALKTLSPQEQDLIRLRFFQDLGHSNIAAELGKSAISVRKMLSRVLSKLRKSKS